MRKLAAIFAFFALPLAAQTVNPNQIRPSGTNGQVMTTVAGQTQWANPFAASLTTSGNSGLSSLSSGVLNIPAYGPGNVYSYANFSSLVGAFTDSSGNVIQPVFLGKGPTTYAVPYGATQLQLGVNDAGLTEETGSWTVSVNGTNYTVSGTAEPWLLTGGINSRYPIGQGGTAPTVVAISNVKVPVTVTYVSGTITQGGLPTGCTGGDVLDAGGAPNCVELYAVGFGYAPGYWTAFPPSAGTVTSVFGRTGDVVAANGDYTVSQVTGAAPLASPTFTGTVTLPSTNKFSTAPSSGTCSNGLGVDASGNVIATSCGGTGGTPAGSSGNPQYNAAGSFGGAANVFYAQAADTISSIETECSSACTYIVTIQQTFTLSANHTLSSNVNVDFQGQGKWTVNGAFTLTIPGHVIAAPNIQIFAGTSTVIGGANTPEDYAEWFGAKGDGTTDDSVALQDALNFEGASIGGNAGWGATDLLCKTYLANTQLNITTGGVSLEGTNQGNGTGVSEPAGYCSALKTASSTITQLSVLGVSATWISDNSVEHMLFERSAAGTGKAISVEYAFRTRINDTGEDDSAIGIYLTNAGSGGTGVIENNQIYWLSGCPNPGYGIEIDSVTGTTPSLRLRNNTVGSPAACTTGYAIYATGKIQDVHDFHTEAGNLGYGLYINGAGGAGTSTDNFFINDIFDQCKISCYYITGMVNNPNGAAQVSVNIQNPWVDDNSSTNAGIDIEGSGGVMVSGATIYNNQQSGIGVYINGGFGNGVSDSDFANIGASGTAILLNGTSDNTISGNQIHGASTSLTVGIKLTASSVRNYLTGNALSGDLATGVSFDTTSCLNDLYNTNQIDPTGITTPLSNSCSTNVVSIVAATGTITTGHCAQWASSNTLSDSGSACGSGGGSNTFTIANATTTGTTTGTLTKITGAPSTAVVAATTDTGGAVGICTSGCGISGNATITVSGLVNCIFSNATTAGDYVQISGATGGDCVDSGATYPISGQVLGRVLSTNAAAGTYQIDLFPSEIKSGGGAGSGALTNITGSVTVSGCTASGGKCTVGTAGPSITFSSIPGTYNALEIVCQGAISDAVAVGNLVMQFNGDTAANYDDMLIFGNNTTPQVSSHATAAQIVVMDIAGASGTAGSSGVMSVVIAQYAGTAFYKSVISNTGSIGTVGSVANMYAGETVGQWRSTAAITSVTLKDSSAGNIIAGSTCSLYGVN